MSKQLHVSNPALKNALECTTQLFTDPDNQIEYLPLEDRLLGTMSFTAATAFTADKTPETVAGVPKGSTRDAVGVQEQMTDGTTATHLNKTKLRGILDSVLNIELKSLTNVVDKDNGIRVPFFGRNSDVSDPFVVMTKGVSMSTSKILEDRTTINYSSEQHYLFIRKKEKTMFKEEHDTLNIYVFDRDDNSVDEGVSMETIQSRRRMRPGLKCEELGFKSFDLKDLQKTGRHSLTIEFGDGRSPMCLELEYEFLTFDNYCAQKEQTTNLRWIDTDTFDEHSDQMLKEMKAVKIEASDPPLPLVYFYNKNTSTQGWIHMCKEQKVLLVSFKGTGAEDKGKDFLTDLNIGRVHLEGTDVDEYKFDSAGSLAQNSGKVHKGFRDVYVSIRDILLETLYSVSLWRPNWLIVFTGHSLGGALATLAAFEASNRTLNGNKPKVAMINFGCPRLATNEFREDYNRSVEVSYRFRAPRDIVPCVPPGFGHVGREVEQGTEGVFSVKDLSFDGQTFLGYIGGAATAVLDPFGIGTKIVESIKYHLRGNYFDTISHAGTKIRELTMKK